MAESSKELQQRISGVTNIQKITRAMEMVATTKLRRLQNRAEGTRPYADTIRRLSASLAASMPDGKSPLTEVRETRARAAHLLITSDRGLCGSYNANVTRMFDRHLTDVGLGQEGWSSDLYVIGKKGASVYRKHPELKELYADAVEQLSYRRAQEISVQLSKSFISGSANGGVDEVWLVYTRFESMSRQTPVAEKILPIDQSAMGETAEGGTDNAGEGTLLEPSPEMLLELLLPKSLAVRIYAAMLDSLASEFAARRMAMKAATDAAGDMIQQLRRRYNRARQEGITSELLDIVGGAEALS